MSGQAPTLLLTRRTRRHAVLFGLTTKPLIVIAAYVFAMVVLTAFLQQLAVLAFAVVGGLVMYAAMRQPLRMDRDPWLIRVLHTVRLRRWPHDLFQPTEDTPVPRPVGDILVLGVSRSSGTAEQAVIRHSLTGTKNAFFTATFEVQGSGDGMRSAASLAREDQELERVLNRLAEPRFPVDELSIMTRATPGLPAAYKEQVRGLRDPSLEESMLADNVDQRLANLDRISDSYRMFVTVRMSEERIYRWTDQRLGATDRETICQAIYSQVGEVADLLDDAGFPTVHGLGPRRLGALIRHLYTPSRAIDDLSGITETRDGFPAYPAPLHEALQVPDWRHDVLWHHATGLIAPYGWPSSRITSRWLLPAVAQMFDGGAPSTIRTITSSWRLLTRRQSAQLVATQQLNTLTQVQRDRGKVTTGEDQDQVDANEQLLYDLRHQSTGVLPSVRVTCSAPAHTGILQARGMVESAMSDLNVDGFTWCDGRQADAMTLSLPLGRGLSR